MLYRILFLIIVLTVQGFSSGTKEVQKKIINVLDGLASSTKTAILIYNPLTEDTIYSMNPTVSMIPASNTKLFTTAAALEIMGGDYLLSTQILTDDTVFTDSTLNGNIYVKGLGNSMFTQSDLDSLVRVIYNMGLRKITGNVKGDDTFFDNIYTRDDWIDDEKANVKLPPVSALIVDRNTKYITRIRRGRRRHYKIFIDNPPLYAAKLLKEKLIDAGIKVEGKVRKGKTPSTAVVIAQSNIELRDLIKQINKHSDNFLAECLFKTIGAVASGKQGNSFYSTQAILTFMEDNAIYSHGTAVVDGSGISRFDQITAGAIVGLLEKVYFDLKNFADFYNSLSIAGVDGTLEDRMDDSKEHINFRGKTGTLNGVSSLSGYLTTKYGDDLIVSIVFEFQKGRLKAYRKAQDKIIKIINNWREESPEDIKLQGY
ncbi:D-alanyl-D-alanine carboxypeptidase precursor [bacterium BMS3Abin03]|nr:D-alanyl-D-alanine carboxypeptidase precursor [bacterium BMS3Abin03]HDZ59082.1 D-alanyl-D-alanine carboxypeptidase/D-alanyl-D-alanine-endopeptidase [Ignavibacteriales bacterium]